MFRQPPRSTLNASRLPYTQLFRSQNTGAEDPVRVADARRGRGGVVASGKIGAARAGGGRGMRLSQDEMAHCRMLGRAGGGRHPMVLMLRRDEQEDEQAHAASPAGRTVTTCIIPACM